jgi:hypothetical protein
MFKRLLQAFRGAAHETPAPRYKNPLDRERARLLGLEFTAQEVTVILCLREILPDGLGYGCSLFGDPFVSRNIFGNPANPALVGGYPHVTVARGINDNGAREAQAVREYARLRKNGYSNEEIEIIRTGRNLWNTVIGIDAHVNRHALAEIIRDRVTELVRAGNLGAPVEPSPPVPHKQAVAAPRRGFGE